MVSVIQCPLLYQKISHKPTWNPAFWHKLVQYYYWTTWTHSRSKSIVLHRLSKSLQAFQVRSIPKRTRTLRRVWAYTATLLTFASVINIYWLFIFPHFTISNQSPRNNLINATHYSSRIGRNKGLHCFHNVQRRKQATLSKCMLLHCRLKSYTW